MCWQRFLCGGLALIVITFVVLLPLFILMRADEDVLWPWAAALIPLWLADALYAALSLFRLVAATRTATGDETPPAPAGSVCSAAISVLTMLCVLASHVLLVLRLSRPDDAAGERALTFTLALSLLAAALLPSALGATWQLLRACAHRLCPQRTPDVSNDEATECFSSFDFLFGYKRGDQKMLLLNVKYLLRIFQPWFSAVSKHQYFTLREAPRSGQCMNNVDGKT